MPARVAFLPGLLLLVTFAWAGESGDPLFRSQETLHATLTAAFSELPKDRDADYVAATLAVRADRDDAEVFDVKIRPRGHLRLTTCRLPPLWLNLKKSQVRNTLFHKQDKLKLIVHCGDTIRYEQAVLREYLAYRVLNLLTPQSFRVRLLRIRYVDSAGSWDDQVRYAFVLEHKNRLGKRIGAKDVKLEETSVEALQPEHLNLTSVFQYLIGNTDFSPIAPAPYDECCHNYELFQRNREPLIAIPYDFDQAGFVNAPYAIPAEQFRIETVRQRVYRGRCANNQYLPASIDRFRQARGQLFELLETHEGLTNMTRASLTRYLRDFFRVLDDPKSIEKLLIDKCI